MGFSRTPLWAKIYDALQPPEKISVSEWATKHRQLDRKWSRYPGPWQSSRAPYLDGVMDAFSSPSVRRISICKPTQMGGTEAMMNMLGYAITTDPGTAMWVHSTGIEQKRTLQRLKSLTSATPLIRQARDEDERYDQSLLACQFRDMSVWLATSRSPSSLASVPCRYVFKDEIDKYKRWTGEEADPCELADRRADSYAGIEKLIGCSTPTVEDGYIWQLIEDSHRVAYFVPCPYCGTYQQLVFGTPDVNYGVKWNGGKNADPDELVATSGAKYMCIGCGGMWDDFTRRAAVKEGIWCDADDGPSKDPTPDPITAPHMGFQWNRLCSTTHHKMADFVAMFLKAQGFPEKLMGFMNNVLAEPFKEVARMASVSVLSGRCQGYNIGETPEKVQMITVGCDVQEDELRYAIRGFGHLEESWAITYGSLPCERGARDWNLLKATVLQDRTTNDGRIIMPTLCLIDSGYVPEEVYAFSRENPWVVRATKGTENQVAPFRQSDLKRVGGVLWLFKPSVFKEYVYARLKLEEDEPGCWHFPLGYEDDYFRELCSHRKERKTNKANGSQTWQWVKKTGVPDHYLDCEVLCCLAARMAGVQALGPVAPQPAQQRARAQQRKKPQSSWVGVDTWEV